ncbi:MAG: hypothetical protein A2X82_02550 [Geobacteraceae bacterium GWC2_55_20]|nr:MAG: hypothetical protein A2X82_02550 [Geobacteraceae bacterium GWC2_55_20]HBA70800.1 hypothetical protein [Geobacter sp.]HCE68088.1 hypothetical protein [Geobacter sp.]
MIIYLDESGDLGFDFNKPKTSRKFVITLLVCQNRDAIDCFRKAVSRTLKNKLNHKKGDRKVQELKGTGTTIEVKQYFYRHLLRDGWELYSVVLNKTRVNDDLRKSHTKKKLYNFLARFILEKIDLNNAAPAVTLVTDRCKNREEIQDFNSYVANQLEAMLPLNVPLNIYHERSHDNQGLQAVDLFCWGIFRKFEMGDSAWYDVYRDAIVFETEYLK